MNEIQFNVPNTSDIISFPIRLDTYAATIQGISRSRLKMGIKSILVNKKTAKLSAKLNGGELIQLEWEDPIPQNIKPQVIPLNIIYEDENVTIVNKKQGMVVHPAAGNWDCTLVNALLYHWGRGTIENTLFTEKQKTALDDAYPTQAFRPGIVHRLDKDTSGCIITARNRNEEAWLQSRFKTHQVQKDYICIVCGHPPAKKGSIKTQILRDSRNRKKFTTGTNPKEGKFAHSLYRCIAIYGPYSLIRVRLKTGRTHQIRVHMKYIGCPILGDPIYGTKDRLFTSATLMLHSRTLGIQLTESDSFKIFKSPVPIRFKKVLKTLHRKYEKCTFQ